MKVAKADYTQIIGLLHNEIPARVNTETGEVKIINPPKPLHNDKIMFEQNESFQKTYPKSWKYLSVKLTNLELSAASRMALLAKAYTNSLEPLNDETTVEDLVTVLGVSKNKVKEVLNTLFNYGVYGKFDVKEANKPHTKYWIFNPYLSFSGKVIDRTIADMFKNTLVAKAFRGDI